MLDNKLTVVDYSPELAHYFDSINRAWIQDMFVVESIDDPEHLLAQTQGKMTWYDSYSVEIAKIERHYTSTKFDAH